MVRIKRLLKSFSYAFKGLKKTYQEEQNIRIQIVFGIFVVCLAIFLDLSRLEFVIILFLIALVILMELINSAVERIADVLKPRINNYIKEIKDIMAGVVLLASVVAVLIGIIVFWPHIFNF